MKATLPRLMMCLAFLASGLPLQAEMGIEEMMLMDVTVASKKALSTRETPGVVTVITRDEIQKSGARDLMEALALLAPGFSFGNDVEGVVAPFARGIWGEEGKILLLVDGLEMNERVFGSTQFGNHYNLENVKRVEVMRGPGSAVYGGYAELAVINVITSGAEMNGGYVSLNNSQMSKTFSHRGGSAGYGKQAGELSSSLTANYVLGNRSQRDIVDFAGNRDQLRNQLNLRDANLALAYRGLQFRTIANQYHTGVMDLWGANAANPYQETFDTYVSELKYDVKAEGGLVLTPRVEYKADYPWVTDMEDQAYTNHKWSERKTAGVTASWDPSGRVNVLGGAEYARNEVRRHENAGPNDEVFRNGKNRIGSDDTAVYAQGIFLSRIVNLTVGSRYDHSGNYGSAFSPRVALTRVIDKFHVKTMASRSFRAPAGILPNRTLPGAGKLKAEKATNYELELGYKLTSSLWWVVNGYDIKIKDPIVYGTDPVTGVGFYGNFGKIGTQGVETELRFTHRFVDLKANYATYKRKATDVDAYKVPGHEDHLLGAPTHRVNGLLSLKLMPQVSLNPSVSFFSKYYAYLLAGEPLNQASSVTLVNANLRMEQVMKNLGLSVGVFNMFDKDYDIPPGYSNAKGSLPSLSRAYTVKATYNFSLD